MAVLVVHAASDQSRSELARNPFFCRFFKLCRYPTTMYKMVLLVKVRWVALAGQATTAQRKRLALIKLNSAQQQPLSVDNRLGGSEPRFKVKHALILRAISWNKPHRGLIQHARVQAVTLACIKLRTRTLVSSSARRPLGMAGQQALQSLSHADCPSSPKCAGKPSLLPLCTGLYPFQSWKSPNFNEHVTWMVVKILVPFWVP